MPPWPWRSCGPAPSPPSCGHRSIPSPGCCLPICSPPGWDQCSTGGICRDSACAPIRRYWRCWRSRPPHNPRRRSADSLAASCRADPWSCNVPYCAILGYLTPKLIDEYAAGRPDAVGYAYAVNVLGCVVGPLFASYFLLPALGVQWASLALALPFLLLATWSLLAERRGANPGAPMSRTAWGAWGTAILCGILAATIGTSFEDRLAAGGAKVLRDHTATVIAIDDEGHKDLLVNGMLITAITPSTKLMAHLPLSQLAHEPKSALVICFGMGTTYRSMLSWGIDVTAVELVPSVRDAFGVFFDDAEQVRNNPRGRIIIDDGRRFLRRTDERFDVITLDPPPPVEAAGSSLLYSREFYQLVKPRLTEGGILQQWYPGGDLKTFQALVHSVSLEFPHVRVTRAFDNWGYHILCSMQPIPERTPQQLFERLPDAARRDLVEWTPQNTGEALLNGVISNRYRPVDIVPSDFAPTITDDHPYNEYYLMRRLWELWSTSYTIVL
ncbi:MAG: fused MFS/spermidine synthase [Planctomycetaceae bacterium]